ncbi:MAG: hypothetical protein V4576_03480 [Patescibacteria group bacterium]
MRAFKFSIFFLIFFLTAPFSVTHAQTAESINSSATATSTERITTLNGGAGGIPELQEQVSYTVIPERPKDNDIVEIKAEMYGTPVADAVFTWTIDGIPRAAEQGLNKIQVQVGQNTKVSLSILTVSGQSLYREWSFNPQNVVLIWEANTYTPPFYKGKSLYTAESALTLNAINLDSQNPLTNSYANYTWKTDGKVFGSDSGVGKNTFVYQGDILQQEPYFELLYSNVTSYAAVQAGKTSPTVNARAVLRVQTLLSDIFTFEKTPLLGVLFNKKIPTVFPVTKTETSLVTYPVYYSLVSPTLPVYTWSLNDTVIKTNSNILTFKKTQNDQKSRLSVEIQNPKSLLQSKILTYIIDTTSNSTGFTAGTDTGFGRQ